MMKKKIKSIFSDVLCFWIHWSYFLLFFQDFISPNLTANICPIPYSCFILFLKGLSFIPPGTVIVTIWFSLASLLMLQMNHLAFAHLSLIELSQILPQSKNSSLFYFKYHFFEKAFILILLILVILTKRPKKIIIEDIKL
jgi:hypothetical protein